MKKPGKMLRETVRHVLKRPATIRYPYVKVEMPAKFRGKIKFDSEKCIGCKACIRDCPSKVINIIKVGDKKFEAEFLNDRCIFCAQCVDTCPKDALEATVEFELAAFDRKSLKTHFRAKLTPNAGSSGPETSGAAEGDARRPGTGSSGAPKADSEA
jgi:formate hydrogenlyase subunit 6/NADH:ubiquinone oxidoreductase subunit I